MITQLTRSKILKSYLEAQQKRIDSVNELILDFIKWFENDVMLELFTEPEKKLVEEIRKNTTLSRFIRKSFAIFLDEEADLDRFEPIRDYFVSNYVNKVCSKGGYYLVLSSPWPTIESDTLNRRLRENKKLNDEVKIKLRYIREIANGIAFEIKLISELCDRPELSSELLKKNAPNIYKRVWK